MSQQISEFSSMNQLQNAFAVAIVNMQSRLQLFEVMDEWMISIERALTLDRYLDPNIPNDVYAKLQTMLKKEYETWDLVKTLYFDRLNENDQVQQPQPFNEPINDKFHFNDMTYAAAIVQGDRVLQEMDLIINWLELNYSRQSDPDQPSKLIAWEQTLDILKRDAVLGRTNPSLISSIDPDAPFREKKGLHPLDDEEEVRIQRGTFHYLRTGNLEKAISFLQESGHIAKAKTLLGSLMSQKETLATTQPTTATEEAGSSKMVVDDDGGVNVNPSNTKYIVTGNPHRLLWKRIAWSVCDKGITPKWERSVLGACCGHRKSMLEVASSWDDKLWAYLKASVNTKVESKLNELNTFSGPSSLPMEFWSQGIGINEILNNLEESGHNKTELTIDNLFQFVQKCAMRNDAKLLVETIKRKMESLFASVDHPLLLDHLVRFLSHLLLAFAIVELAYDEHVTNVLCDSFVHVLVKQGLFVGIPYYIRMLSSHMQISVVESQINTSLIYPPEEIREFLQGAADNDLDILGIAVAIVEKFRKEVEPFDVAVLQWIRFCYDFTSDQDAVMLQYLRFTVLICRKYLTLGDLERVKSLIKEVTPDCINVVEKISPPLVREFVCYREYLEAEDGLAHWKQAKAQRPSMMLIPEAHLISLNLSDRAAYEKKRRDHEINEGKWLSAVGFHAKHAITALMKILKFPDGGWLQGCCDPENEEDVVSIAGVRRIIIKKVVMLLLNLLKEKNSSQDFRAFVYTLCEGRRRILEELLPQEIGAIFKVVEAFTKTAAPELTTLP